MLLALLPLLFASQSADVALHPRAIVGADGALIADQYVVIRGERIQSLSATPPAGVRVIALDGVLAPGMVDANSGFGAASRLTEESRALSPGLRAADGVDLDRKEWEEFLAQGLTAVHLTPEPSNALAGWGTLLATGGTKRRIAETTVQLASLIGASYDERIGPTALAGLLELLEPAFAARGKEFARGVSFAVEDAEGIRAARALCERHGVTLRPFMLYGEIGAYAGEAAGGLIILPALGASGARAREAEVLKRLHGAGTRIAFGTRGGNSGPDALRLSAMLLSRATGDPALAWNSVSRAPAEALGLEKELGVIAQGARADLVLWSAHPLDAAARVLSVMIGGETVHASAPVVQ